VRRAIAVRSRGDWPDETELGSVTLPYLDRHRRRIRLITDAGEAFLLDLPRASHLADGDGLELEEGGYIRVRAAPEPLLEISADNRTLLRITWHLGNRHLPIQATRERLRIREDRVIEQMVIGLGGQLHRIEAPFDPEIGAYSIAAHHHDDDETRHG
jgi:urease accessory protein